MSGFGGTEASILTSALPPSSSPTAGFTVVLVGFASVAAVVRYAAPVRLTRILVSTLATTEQTYLGAVETSQLSAADISAVGSMLSILQDKVSAVHEASLRSSLSWRATVGEFLRGRTFTVVQCLWDVRNLHTHIEILQEANLRSDNLHTFQAVSVRRRNGIRCRRLVADG
ncbi:hypothetical protein K438DRAFT_1953599 [Mycena galopus ATCC 62051]|nr:hypothetical protein K438DRAFT_1953599 [Mycena galopus ATCC 62051]